MKKFFRRAGRAVWSWRALKIVLWLVTLIVLFYMEEDWRGARLWAATKAKWEARGETFDLRKFIPPPVPDEENLGRLPLFRTERVGGKNGQTSYLDPVALRAAFKGYSFNGSGDFPPPLNRWTIGERPNLGRLRTAVAEQYAETFKAPTSLDARGQLETIYPFLPELRVEAQKRRFCRFDYDDSQALPAGRALGLIADQIKVSRLLTLDALLALANHQPDLALDDYEAILKLRTGAAQDPSLVGALVSAGMFSVAGNAIFEGLAGHAWDDTQLDRLDGQLAGVDFLKTYQFAMRSEAALSVANLDYFRNVKSTDLGLFFKFAELGTLPPPSTTTDMLAAIYTFFDEHWRRGYALWPRGWFDENKALTADRILQTLDLADDQKHRVYPPRPNRQPAIHPENSLASLLPWRVIATVIGPVQWAAARKFATEQVMVDEMRLAVALERYRLKHQAYPANLSMLVPEELAVLPCDVTTGLDYRYRLRANGTFLLYSIGWNGKDDGGTTVFSAPNGQDYEQGDWVWPTPN